MRVVLDTNILVSAMLMPMGNPAAVYTAWHEGRFTLITCAEQIEELRATLRKPTLSARIRPYQAGRVVNELRAVAVIVESLPDVTRSPDSGDDFLLALSEAGQAAYLVTGAKSGLLVLAAHRGTRMVSAKEFVEVLR